ncbi:P-loop containing nucleoside triphosphate hydrolase protein [Halenospora varia]|nr:P-loop containing nucleoside triphosphate hydrolase protein [Halenospora varia]
MNLANPVQLDMIDGLRGLGISNFVALPQLAVVGDQSSGKSSVLKSFSELPFPRDSGLCTRFATQIIFRRDSTSSIKVSIIPGPDQSLQETDRLRGYVKDGLTALTSNEFLDILYKVCQLMGIPGPGQPLKTSQSTFSDDLLSIELCSSDKQNLSIIDIPGIFRTPTEGVTTVNDMALRTIILAVIPIKELGSKGLRTLGVLTKPDLIDKEGKRNQLRLRYCIVRNRGQSELLSDASKRYRKEKEFFAMEPWSRRLQELLVSITRQEFPKVQAQIRRFLLEISQNFQDMTNCALDAFYSRHTVFGSAPGLRIATLAVERIERFAKDIDTLGHTVNFDSEAKEEVAAFESPLVSSTPSSNGSEADAKNPDLEYPELSDLMLTNGVAPKPSDRSIMEWIGEEYRKARGFGLATIGPSILPTIWQEQSKNWEGLTLAYIADIMFFAHDFIYKALTHVCLDEGVRSSLWSVLQEQLLDRYRAAVAHIGFIIRVERFGTPLTTNHYFNDNLQRCKTLRLEKLLGRHAESRYPNRFGSPQPREFVRIDQIKQSMTIDNSEYTVQDIYNILESYYKVARKRFVDTVYMQGSDFHLLTGPTSPLRIFGTAFVSKLSAAQLDLIAGEDISTKQLRKSLKNEIAALEKGKRLLRV